MGTHYDAERNGLFAVCDLLALVNVKELDAFKYLSDALGDSLFKVCNGDILIAYNCKVSCCCGELGQGLVGLGSSRSHKLGGYSALRHMP